ncbi:hypothetical protein KCP78_18035 [Salmonella enterica subsp. enterica]|nr:hypothetical protein KCP78_18035 [Salmonella enterica subsp. enterica]
MRVAGRVSGRGRAALTHAGKRLYARRREYAASADAQAETLSARIIHEQRSAALNGDAPWRR